MKTALRKLREDAGDTQRSLAALCGVSVTAVANWESGKWIPGSKNLLVLADHFGVSPRDVIADRLGGK